MAINGAWFAAHKTQVALGGAGVAGLLALMRKKSTATAANTAGTVSTTTGSAVPAGGYSSDPYSAAQDAYNSLEPQLASLQSQIGLLSSGASSPAPGAPAAAATPPTAPAPAAPTPANIYPVGANVQPGEAIVASVLDQTGQGYYDLTSKGGVYTSGDATLHNATAGGSYLGYFNSLPASTQHAQGNAIAAGQLGNFSHGTIVDHGGGYAITDNVGHTYAF